MSKDSDLRLAFGPMPQRPISVRKQPRQARSVATVDTILEAAARILEREGLQAFNTNAVAAKAGVSVGSIYQYFPSKEALLAALIRRERAKLLQAIEQEKRQADRGDLRSALDGFIRAALSHQFERPRLANSLEYAETMLPIDEETSLLKRSIVSALANVLSSFGVAEPETAARDLSALTRGMVDEAGLLGEIDVASLHARVSRAVYGYLRV